VQVAGGHQQTNNTLPLEVLPTSVGRGVRIQGGQPGQLGLGWGGHLELGGGVPSVRGLGQWVHVHEEAHAALGIQATLGPAGTRPVLCFAEADGAAFYGPRIDVQIIDHTAGT
jgi:hypothetical protein